MNDTYSNSLMRKMQGFFAALRMAERRVFQHPGGGGAMLRAKVCLAVLVAAVACASRASAQCAVNVIEEYPSYALTVTPQSVTCTQTVGGAPAFTIGWLFDYFLMRGWVPGYIFYQSGPAPVIHFSGSGAPPGGYVWLGGSYLGMVFFPGGYNEFYVSLNTVGEYVFVFSDGAGPGVTVTVNVVPPPINGADLGMCKQCVTPAGSPINLTNGNVYIQQRDYSVPGLGGGLALVRTWNSRLQDAGPPSVAGMFGYSWRSTYEEMLTGPDSNNNLTYWRGDGSAWTFTYNSVLNSYSLSSPPDERAQLVSNLTGGFTLTLADGTQKVFNSQNLLAAVIDRNNNQTTLAYDSSNRLTSVTSPGGSTLNFTYGDPNNPNQATTAQDSVGVVATYTYDSSSRLTKVSYPDGSALNFSIDPYASMILSVTDSQGKLLESHTYNGVRQGLTSSRAYGVDSVSLSY